MFRRKNFAKHLAGKGKCFTFATVLKTAPRGGAVVARWAHNPKAGGSIPSPATRRENDSSLLFFYHTSDLFRLIWGLTDQRKILKPALFVLLGAKRIIKNGLNKNTGKK